MAIVPNHFGGVEFDVRHVVVNSQIWFSGKDGGETLEYANSRKACRDAVKDKYKKRLDERNAIYISEPGLWQWLGNSNQTKAEPFQNYLWEECLPTLRKTMVSQAQYACLKNETNLHHRVVAFIKRFTQMLF